jgi:polyhydroxyalkanoate synthesis repressor PhaR
MNSENSEHIIKKYSNRRLYDTAISRYITLEDVRRLVKSGVKFRVVDAKTDEDLTRCILLQLIVEQEERGQAIFTTEILELIVKTYGDAMQGFMAIYIRESMNVFLKQQKLMQEQMANLINTAPVSVFTEVAKQNLRLWQSVQDGFLKAMSSDDTRKDGGTKPPKDG